MKTLFRRAAVATVAVGTALTLAAMPSIASAHAKPKPKPDPYTLADTEMTTAASAAGGGSTFAGPLENAAQAFYQARNANATLAGYALVGSGAGEKGVITGTYNWGGTDVPLAQTDIAADESSGQNFTLANFLQVRLVHQENWHVAANHIKAIVRIPPFWIGVTVGREIPAPGGDD